MLMAEYALSKQGKRDDAEWWLQSAYTCLCQAHGPDNPSVEAALTDLAMLWDKTGNHDLPLNQRYYKSTLRAHDHLNTWIALNNVGMNVLNRGDYANAKTIFAACANAAVTREWQLKCVRPSAYPV
ncbi:Aste57867_23680 [Aphanomyces stellatus]|uniref:Aste57867_23680 protein n=1 Tax=Aphanomyces stellatus TaxID=120398 RepID=A0A485LPE9_9STRA|nr:hypothetical protein As57867_023608 [Aphanomyces stellatus]VFU00325.1 Aste57867_23680 [Aphanomyces stellatus]